MTAPKILYCSILFLCIACAGCNLKTKDANESEASNTVHFLDLPDPQEINHDLPVLKIRIRNDSIIGPNGSFFTENAFEKYLLAYQKDSVDFTLQLMPSSSATIAKVVAVMDLGQKHNINILIEVQEE